MAKAKSGKRGRPKKVAGEPPSGEGLSSDELEAHMADAFGVTKPDPEELEGIPKPVESEDPTPEVIAEPEKVAESPEPAGEKKEAEETLEPIEAKEEGKPSDAAREAKEEGERQEKEVASEKKAEEPWDTAGLLRELSKLREQRSQLQEQLQSQTRAQMLPGQGATALPPQQEALPVFSSPPIAWDSEGKPILPDSKDPAMRAYIQALQQPTPEELYQQARQQFEAQQLARQREFEAAKTTFIQEDPRRKPIVERVQMAAQFLDLRAQEVMDRTKEQPIGGEAIAQFLERYGIADEFRRYVPEVDATELPYFLDAIFSDSNLTLRRYMTQFCERILGAKPDGEGSRKQQTAGQQFTSGDIPPRLAAQGLVQADRTGKPGKVERMKELSKIAGETPFEMTKAMHEELKDLRKDLGIEVATLS